MGAHSGSVLFAGSCVKRVLLVPLVLAVAASAATTGASVHAQDGDADGTAQFIEDAFARVFAKVPPNTAEVFEFAHHFATCNKSFIVGRKALLKIHLRWV
jgi:hypothetical protein